MSVSQKENREGGVFSYPCQRDGPEGYDSPVPASEWLEHQAEARTSRAENTHTRPLSPTQQLLNQLRNFETIYVKLLLGNIKHIGN